MEIFLLLIFTIFILILGYFYFYNQIISLRQRIKQSWAGIDVQLKRRYDLIPNLIRVVSEYATHEKKILESISEIRTKALAVDSQDIPNRLKAEIKVDSNIKSLIAVAESYPDLKANKNFLKLQEELTETEDQIASARRIYNSNVANYNMAINTFPKMFIARLHQFKESTYFQK